MRILAKAPLGRGNAHHLQDFKHTRTRLRVRCLGVLDQRFAHLIADAQERRKRAHWVLEDQRHVNTANGIERLARSVQNLASVQLDAAAGCAVFGQQAHHRHEGLALARTRLANDAEAFALPDGQVEAIDGPHLAVVTGETHR